MSTSNVIGSMQSALDCAGKCDCCEKLQQQINTLNAQVAQIPRVDVNAVIDKLKIALVPVIGGIVIQQTTPLSQALRGEIASTKTGIVRDVETDINRAMQRSMAETLGNVKTDFQAIQQRLDNVENVAAQANSLSNTTLNKVAGIETSAANAAKNAELAKGLSNQAKNEVIGASTKATNAVTEAATASRAALNASADANGLRQIVNGIGSKVDGFGRAIATLETKVGTAITNAAKAVGISSEALAATGRLAGRILEIFQVIGTLFTLIEQLATLNVLGDRIDAVENGVQAIGADLSRVLGKLLGLQNRIGANEALTAQVKNIALDAKGIGEAANLKAGAAQVTAVRAENFSIVANANAKTAQTTADGAVRNASTANENATTAYQKANEAQGIGEQAKRIAQDALNKAGTALTTAFTAIALYQTVKSLRGLQGIRGLPGRNGKDGASGRDGITTVVQIPGVPGAPGRNGIAGRNGRDGRNGVDAVPYNDTGLRALIISQHAATRANINTTTSGLVNGIKGFFTTQLAGITALITAIATNTYVEKALAVLTFAATIHNGLMLSNNLAQTLGTIIDQVLGFILPKGLDGTPLSIGNVLGKVAHEIIADTVGEANYQHISEDWAKANRIYQASVNVFNQIGNAVGLVTAGMEVIGGNVAKIGNALKVWGVIGEKAYSWMNPQPNLKGKFFNFINTATAEANTIAMMVAIPIGISVAAAEINSSIGTIKKELDQEDPKDDKGHPITDALGNPLKWEPGVTVPDPTKTILAQEQAKADSKNIIAATLEDIFDGGD